MPVRTYSSGMMLRLNFAVATCFEPEILLMDEWIVAGDEHFMAKAEKRIDYSSIRLAFWSLRLTAWQSVRDGATRACGWTEARYGNRAIFAT